MCLKTFQEEQEVTAVEFHPDGLMMIAGLKDGTMKIYDMRSQLVIAIIADFKGEQEIGNISFSNRGLNFGASWKGSEVCRVFNLKKLGKEVYTLPHSAPVNQLQFDYYGNTIVTCAGSSLNVYAVKQWDAPVVSIPAHEDVVNVARFSCSGQFLVSGSEDRFLKVFGL